MTLSGSTDTPPATGSTIESKWRRQIDYQAQLLLIQPDEIRLKVQDEGAEFGKVRRRVRAMFTFQGTFYSFVVTDPVVEAALFPRSEPRLKVEAPYLCISLSEPYEGFCYKLVAAIIKKRAI